MRGEGLDDGMGRVGGEMRSYSWDVRDAYTSIGYLASDVGIDILYRYFTIIGFYSIYP